MDVDLDLDFDLEDDKIKKFLQNKLQEIRLNNEKLEQSLNGRREISQMLMGNEDLDIGENSVSIGPDVWKKIYNNKYVLITSIVNNANGCLDNIKTILKWSSSHSLTYQVNIFEETKDINSAAGCDGNNCDIVTNFVKKACQINNTAFLVIVLEKPKFLDNLSYDIIGNILFCQDNRKITLLLPPVTISVSDMVNNQLTDLSLSNGEIKDLLAMISCTEQTSLMIIFPEEWTYNLDSTFEIHCSLTKILVSSGCKKFFVARRLSPSFNDCLLELHIPNHTELKTCEIIIHCRDEESLLSFLHHLYQNIHGVIIIPESVYQNYVIQHCDNSSSHEKIFQNFREAIYKEIQFVRTSMQKLQTTNSNERDEVNKFRSKLADLEMQTDFLQQQVACFLNKSLHE